MFRPDSIVCLFYMFCWSFVLVELSSDNVYPQGWLNAATSLTDYPLTNNCSSSRSSICRSIDPWNYVDRLGLYKILINVTTPLMPFTAKTNASNILFGLPSQFSWQFSSNRLFSDGTDLVSSSSWWASANYYLSIVPFLAAVDAGLISRVPFELKKKESFCSSVAECLHEFAQPMNLWKQFFVDISRSDYCRSSSIDDRLIDRCFLKPMWSAHVASIKSALPLIQSKISLLPSGKERQFALAWANLVDFIGKSRKNTNLTETMAYQQEFLPDRMLNEQDEPPHIADLPFTVNKAVELLLSIKDDWYPELKVLWQPATCNFEARVDAQKVLEVVSLSKVKALTFYSEAIVKSRIFACDQD